MTPQELKKYNTANMNFYDYVVHYLNTHTDGYKLGAYDSYMGIANAKLKTYFKELHQYSLKDVTVDVLDEFFEYCRSVGLKGTTMKRYKSLISKPLQKAYKSRIIPENPLDFIDEISVEDFECDPLKFDESVILAEKLNDKYQIKMSDVQEFIDSNVEVDYSALPSVPVKKANRDIMYDNLNLKKAREYYDGILKDKPPVISTVDICQITGYTNESVRRWIKKGFIKTFYIVNSYATTKEQFLEFLLSREYNDIEQKSELHEKTNLQFTK